MGSKRAQKAKKRAKREARRQTRRARRLAAPEKASTIVTLPEAASAIETAPEVVSTIIAAPEKTSTTAATLADPFIGYVASDGLQVACEGDACIVVGSRKRMQRILDRFGDRFPGMNIIQATGFGQIARGMEIGEAYCFDEDAYAQFLGPAQRLGMPVADRDFSDPGPMGLHLARVQQFGYLSGK